MFLSFQQSLVRACFCCIPQLALDTHRHGPTRVHKSVAYALAYACLLVQVLNALQERRVSRDRAHLQEMEGREDRSSRGVRAGQTSERAMDDHKTAQDATLGAPGDAASPSIDTNDSHSTEAYTASTIDHGNDSTGQHIKQDSVDSYNTSSSSSSVDFKEANSGENSPERSDVTALRDIEGTSTTTIKQDDSSTSPSLENRLSGVSLGSSKASENRTESASRDRNDSTSDKSVNRNSISSSRRVSLQQPETPSSPIPEEHQSSNTNSDASLLKKQLDETGVRAERDSENWRDSTAESSPLAMDTIALSDSRPTSVTFSSLATNENSSFEGVEIPLDDASTSAPEASTSAGTSNGKHLSANTNNTGEVGSSEMGTTPTRQSTASSTHNYDLIQQRAENHHHDLEEHPKRRSRTLRGSEDLRASFDKLREELSGPNDDAPKPDSPVREAPPLPARKSKSGAPAQDTNVIDWDFWGEVMSDYEGIAKTRRKLEHSYSTMPLMSVMKA
jgi:hypothetical protein